MLGRKFTAMNFLTTFCVVCSWFIAANAGVNLKQHIPALNDYDPGSCNDTRHGHEVLVKTRADQEIILVCVKDKDGYRWKTTDGMKRNSLGEFFNAGYDCSDILDKVPDATDGFYWINLRRSSRSSPTKVWCDMNTDGGGFMLIGRKNNPMTYTFPSSNSPVKPFGKPHWTSSLGEAPILDFRVQIATKDDFKSTKAHWYFRLKARRALKNLMMNSAGCNRRSAGIGNIAYVKDLQTDKVVTTKLRCSKFGYAYHHLAQFGWTKMNSCLKNPCSLSFAYHDLLKIKLDFDGSFSYNTDGSISGMEYNSTAFIGCDNGKCCGCYGPPGGTNSYCAERCQVINGGKVNKKVFTWFWIRSALPKRLWNKCMDYTVKRNDGKLVWYKLVGHRVLPVEGRCKKDIALLHDGIVVIPDFSTQQKVPDIDGLLTYRKDKQELYVRSNHAWDKLAQENKVLKNLIEPANQKLENKVRNVYNQLIQMKTELKNLSVFLVHKECYGFKWLNESTRNKNFVTKDFGKPYIKENDDQNRVFKGWYRFGGAAGTNIATTCVKGFHCGAHGAGWMNGTHPRLAEGKVTRKLCFGLSDCCWHVRYIKVINCGKFYIYHFPSNTGCAPCRYCGTH